VYVVKKKKKKKKKKRVVEVVRGDPKECRGWKI